MRGTYEQLFGLPTGRHSHPDTHPSWMEFTMQDCPRCLPGFSAHSQAGVEAIREASK